MGSFSVKYNLEKCWKLFIALSAKQLNINVHYLFSSLLNKVIKNHNSDEQRTDSLIKDFWEMFDLILS